MQVSSQLGSTYGYFVEMHLINFEVFVAADYRKPSKDGNEIQDGTQRL